MTRVTITSEQESTGKKVIIFSWELTSKQLYELNEFANELVGEQV